MHSRTLCYKCYDLISKSRQKLSEEDLKSKLGIISLLDPNGSGKATMIKLSNGLLQSNDGKVLINGLQPSSEAKKNVFYLPDTTYLNENMKVKDALQYFKSF